MKPVLLALLFLLAMRAATRAVITRDDVPDSAYIALAADDRFQAGRVIIFPTEDSIHASGVLIGSRYILTAGHIRPFVAAGPQDFTIAVGGVTYHADYAYTNPNYPLGMTGAFGGFDLSIIRLDAPVTTVSPTSIWTGGLALGQIFTGIGQGKSGTGLDADEPLDAGVLRGYQNTIDYIYGDQETFNGAAAYGLLRSDFDSPNMSSNTLATTLFADQNKAITGTSQSIALPLEGSVAAGDSGSGIWIDDGGTMRLAGITSFRYFSAYGGQPGYVNLSDPQNLKFIQSVAQAEGVTFAIVPEARTATLIACATALFASLRRRRRELCGRPVTFSICIKSSSPSSFPWPVPHSSSRSCPVPLPRRTSSKRRHRRTCPSLQPQP